jgi:hypothetical protein
MDPDDWVGLLLLVVILAAVAWVLWQFRVLGVP